MKFLKKCFSIYAMGYYFGYIAALKEVKKRDELERMVNPPEPIPQVVKDWTQLN